MSDDNLTPEQHANIEYDVDTAMQNAAAQPGLAKLRAMVAAIVEGAFYPALSGKRVQSCMHSIDQSYVPGVGYAPIGSGRESDRRVYLCTQYPDRLMCDNPASKTGPGCMDDHFVREHQYEVNVRCFACDELIPEDQVTPVFAVIELRSPLPVYDMHDRTFKYEGEIETLPITYLCVRHSGAVQLPVVIEWRRS